MKKFLTLLLAAAMTLSLATSRLGPLCLYCLGRR